jgi:DNA-binding PadR family transcriptional regulator
VSPIFRHGRLRLYLLKLLDEAPRHGYEVIRLLQDRFMGVYSPSPGTIYPRLARLEEDGLVTHDEVDGRKVYRITEKGREEIRARLDDLAELEDELSESVRDIAREVTEDVRDTVRSLREEITWAARDIRREAGTGRRRGRPGEPEPEAASQDDTGQDRTGQDRTRQDGTRQDETAGGAAASAGTQDDTGQDDAGHDDTGQDDARRIRDEARRAREDIRDTFRPPRGARSGGGSQDWGGTWADRAAGWQAWGDRKGRGARGGDRPGWAGWQDWTGMPTGLERLASEFARELRSAAGHAGDIGEGALGDLREILSDTLARIRDEVFDDEPGSRPAAPDEPGDDAPSKRDPGPAEPGSPEQDD